MAFDLVQYFAAQIKLQKPSLLKQYNAVDRDQYIQEINALSLGKLVSLWREDNQKLYQEIDHQDELYIQEIARRLTTSPHNQSPLSKTELEQNISEVLALQLTELKQLDQTGNFGNKDLGELLLGQIEHLSGQADDWVWSTNDLIELKGSKPIPQEELSLEASIKEFNQMVQQHTHDDHQNIEPVEAIVPTWSKVLEPIVAIAILAILWCSVTQLFA
ncbi:MULTISPECIES: hypothetical protein [Acinetobacter]|uniref:hypothetical protein n=1 Tax=Acinetobacter TaxID=469 RepID=UPI0015B62578|nr:MULTISPECIES: hypothetical protein [Acinetobacter]MBT0888636.1 hypothetical protein [Acinetobacter towneri]NWJ94040.1 hypothetical protein [Acinetobacter sp. Swhac1]